MFHCIYLPACCSQKAVVGLGAEEPFLELEASYLGLGAYLGLEACLVEAVASLLAVEAFLVDNSPGEEGLGDR
jgi:hypothetical protein